MLMRFDPFNELDKVSRSLFSSSTTPDSTMALDAVRRGNEFVVSIDLPGIDLDTLDVTVERNALSVAASRMTSHREGDQGLISERPVGRFSRQLFLSDNVDSDNITADYRDGVLELHIPIADSAKPRKIAVNHQRSQPELQTT